MRKWSLGRDFLLPLDHVWNRKWSGLHTSHKWLIIPNSRHNQATSQLVWPVTSQSHGNMPCLQDYTPTQIRQHINAIDISISDHALATSCGWATSCKSPDNSRPCTTSWFTTQITRRASVHTTHYILQDIHRLLSVHFGHSTCWNRTWHCQYEQNRPMLTLR